ncbi:MAG TPA: hypothetical protein VI759_06600 [Dehalococcoidia bacterium]|nr:hypothetical protein [Dehalococcoidia bacterium]
MNRTLPGRRYRRFIYVTAHVAVLFYVLQIIAIDHWQVNPADAIGVEGSSAHVVHCHGDVSGCAESGGLVSLLDATATMPLPPAAFLSPITAPDTIMIDVVLTLPDQPPRAA